MRVPDRAQVYAVLTGDIIASSDMDASRLETVRKGIQFATERFSNDYRSSVEARIDMYRGDGWQLVLTEQELAMRLAVFIQADLRARFDADTRIAIGLGNCEQLDRTRVSLSTGEAFMLSGRALEAMTGYFDLTAALPDRAGPLRGFVPASLHACSQIIRGWTNRQAEIVALALLHPEATHESLAGRLDPPVRKQAVTGSLNGAGWRGLLEPVEAFEAVDWVKLLEPIAVRS